MIIDSLKNCVLYYGANEKFEKAFDFIKQAVKDNLPAGKYEIDGKDLYASVLEYDSKAEADAKYEAHEKYIDIQYIVAGREAMNVIFIDKAKVKGDYNPDKDVVFFEHPEEAIRCLVEAGEYGIFFPDDVHQPSVAVNGVSAPVKKIVVKVKM